MEGRRRSFNLEFVAPPKREPSQSEEDGAEEDIACVLLSQYLFNQHLDFLFSFFCILSLIETVEIFNGIRRAIDPSGTRNLPNETEGNSDGKKV